MAISNTNQLIPPGASMYFEVYKLSFLIYDTGGSIRVKAKLKKSSAQLEFVFRPFLRSCIPADVTQNKGNLTYDKIQKPDRDQSELIYIIL